MVTRRITINVENLAERGTLHFGGEWFDCGGWSGERVSRIEEHATLQFENKVVLQGVGGYVYYHNADHTQVVMLCFTCPVTTGCCFTARAGPLLPDCQKILDRVPELGRPGAGLRRAESCAWETQELQDEQVVVRCIVLATDTHGAVRAGGKQSDEFLTRLAKARWCRSTVEDASEPETNESLSAIVERRVLLEVDNRFGETFIYDGDWFMSGRWQGKPVQEIAASGVTKLEFSADEMLRGLCGLAWFVSKQSLDVYISFCFSNPLASSASFCAWAGPPPHDLREVLLSGAPLVSQQEGVQVPPGLGCAWNIVQNGALIHVRVVILQDLAAIDFNTYPPRSAETCEAPETKNATEAAGPPDARQRSSSSGSAAATATSATNAAASSGQPAASSASASSPHSRGPPAEALGPPSTSTAIVLASSIHPPVQLDDDEAAGNNFAEWFMNVTRPRDALDGAGSGLKVAGAGIVAGAALMVTLPVIGAREEGVAGFVSGVCKGVAAAVTCTLGGVVAGSTQIVRGVANTPDAIQQVQAGKRWDAEAGEWVDDTANLREEIAQAETVESSDDEDSDEERPAASNSRPAAGDGASNDIGRSGRRVADTSYYDAIGVSPAASPGDVKKAYYKAALRVHPDKNPGDPEASMRFQQLAQAYQVLSDNRLRDRYDQMGQEGVSEAGLPAVDPALFFSTLFGSESFERYIGKLYLAMQTDHIAKDLQKDLERRHQQDGSENSHLPDRDAIAESLEREMRWSADSKKARRIKQQQFVREVTCAKNLVEKLDRWVLERDEPGFTQAISQEASELVQVSFGGRLLRTIGGVYESCAEQWFANQHGNFTLEMQLAQWRESAQAWQVRANALSSCAKSAMAVKRMHDVASTVPGEEAEMDQEKKEEAARQTMSSLEESLPVILQTIWDISAVDIESTLRHVCRKVLKDISVPWQIRWRRAGALLRLARIFRDVGQLEHTDLSKSAVAKQHLEEAIYGAIREKGGG